jgi:hypothetical protein
MESSGRGRPTPLFARAVASGGITRRMSQRCRRHLPWPPPRPQQPSVIPPPLSPQAAINVSHGLRRRPRTSPLTSQRVYIISVDGSDQGSLHQCLLWSPPVPVDATVARCRVSPLSPSLLTRSGAGPMGEADRCTPPIRAPPDVRERGDIEIHQPSRPKRKCTLVRSNHLLQGLHRSNASPRSTRTIPAGLDLVRYTSGRWYLEPYSTIRHGTLILVL